jgi:hypothetical protein
LKEADWQMRKHTWGRRAFYRTSHSLLFHIPIGIAGAIRRGMNAAKAKGYTVEPPHMMLDDETGRFSADMLIALKETPEKDPNVVTWEGATLYSRYYHGPFRGLKHEVQELGRFVETEEQRKPRKIYTWVTNCPRCWKEQGGPTTVLFAQV